MEDGSGNEQAEVLWEMGAGNGMSLVLQGSDIVFSASSDTNANGAVEETSTLGPADFEKPITLRVALDHKVSSTDFHLSGVVSGGSTISSGVVLMDFTGYLGTNLAGIGNVFGGKITGIDGTPFGPPNTLPNGIGDVLAWSSGSITYEIAGTVAAPVP